MNKFILTRQEIVPRNKYNENNNFLTWWGGEYSAGLFLCSSFLSGGGFEGGFTLEEFSTKGEEILCGGEDFLTCSSASLVASRIAAAPDRLSQLIILLLNICIQQIKLIIIFDLFQLVS